MISLLDTRDFSAHFPSLQVFRTELITPGAIGNKYYKLGNNLRQRDSEGARIATFGGAWSNHIHAFASMMRYQRGAGVAIIRGQELSDSRANRSEILRFAVRCGVQLHFVSRQEYRQRHCPGYQKLLKRQLGVDLLIPEGGSNLLAIRGCGRLMAQISRQTETPKVVVAAVGTGATLAGLIAASKPGQFIYGIDVVGDGSTCGRIENWLAELGLQRDNWTLDSVAGRPYGKIASDTLELMFKVYSRSGVALDPLYTGPALAHVLAADWPVCAPRNWSPVFVHTGGLSGSRGITRTALRALEPQHHASIAGYFETVKQLIGETTRDYCHYPVR